MAKRSKIAARTKTTAPKAKAAARRRLADRKPGVEKPTLRVKPPKPRVKPHQVPPANDGGSALASLTALLAGLPGLVVGAAAPAMRKTGNALAGVDTAAFIGSIMDAIAPVSDKKTAKRQIAEEAAVLAAAVALIALRRKLPLMKIVGSGVPGNIVMLLKALSALRR